MMTHYLSAEDTLRGQMRIDADLPEQTDEPPDFDRAQRCALPVEAVHQLLRNCLHMFPDEDDVQGQDVRQVVVADTNLQELYERVFEQDDDQEQQPRRVLLVVAEEAADPIPLFLLAARLLVTASVLRPQRPVALWLDSSHIGIANTTLSLRRVLRVFTHAHRVVTLSSAGLSDLWRNLYRTLFNV